MRILKAEDNKPEDRLVKVISEISTKTLNVSTEAKDLLDKNLTENQANFVRYSDKLSALLDEALQTFASKDNRPDMTPVANEVATLKSSLDEVKQAIKNSKTEVNVPPPDLSKLEDSIKRVPLAFQALIKGIDVMEREELDKNFKEIIKLLKKIAAVEWVSQGTTIVGGGGGGSTDGLTDTQLRATAVPVSGFPADYPLPAGQVTTLTPPAAITGFATANKQDTLLTELQLKADLTETQPVQERSKVSLLAYAQILTANATIIPSSGKKIELIWTQVIPNSDNSTSNAVTISFVSLGNIYNVYALGRSAIFTGATNEVLNITLTNAQPVSVNIQYREI